MDLIQDQVIQRGTDQSFSDVSLSFFFGAEPKKDSRENDIVVFTTYQEKLIQKLKSALIAVESERIDRLDERIANVTSLARAISLFPSLLERATTTTSTRTPMGLVENLITHHESGDSMLHLPSKAILGKGFLVAKIHTFHSMTNLARNYTNMNETEVQEYYDETISMMCNLMAEDVYINLMKDHDIPIELRRELANSLLILWEHRSDQTISDIAPVLQLVWAARRSLAPTFGTMMGATELLMLTFQLDDQWAAFIKEKLVELDVTQAMEEFLFGISHEQILKLKAILRDKGVKSIDRDEVSTYLNERVKTDVNMDYRDFYMLYTISRDNARARRRLHLEGPKNTLEDHFIRFVMEKNHAKQQQDALSHS